MQEFEKENLCLAKEIAHALIDLSDLNEKNCESDICFLIYGVLRDCGYQVKKIIDEEKNNSLEC